MIPTIVEAAKQIRDGRLTPTALLEQCLANIDRHEASIRAWVSVDRDGARAAAEKLAGELRSGHWRGPLHGIPVGIKDIFDVFDWPTAAGSRLWARSFARADSTVVARLRQAGAIILGKTVTTQYASFDPPPTRNPWNIERTPGGSSSGSAAAVAAGMCLGTIGSQTGGSITRPASFCGVASCKPAYGRVSLNGVVPLAHSMDHPGPMAACVGDLAILLQCIAGHDPLDRVSNSLPVPDYRSATETPGAPRLGWLRGFFDDLADPCMLSLMEDVARRLVERGAQMTPLATPPAFGDVLARHRTVMAVEAASFHQPRLERHPEDYDPNITQLLREGIACPAPEYARCKQQQAELRRAMENCLLGFDALLCPATRGPAPDAATTGDPAFNSPWSYTGLPSVAFPAGFAPDGMPLCVQFIGRSFDEERLFAAAAWSERCLDFHAGKPRGL